MLSPEAELNCRAKIITYFVNQTYLEIFGNSMLQVDCAFIVNYSIFRAKGFNYIKWDQSGNFPKGSEIVKPSRAKKVWGNIERA